MFSEYEKTTVLDASVGADAERSPVNEYNTTLPQNSGNFNPIDPYYAEIERKLALASDPHYLPTLSMVELFQNTYARKPPLIAGLLGQGIYLFVGAPKVGKSFLMAQLAYHVSVGLPFWGVPVDKGTVLYLALEDTYNRLQNRLFRMFGVDCAPNLHLSINASPLADGLLDQLNLFCQAHPDTRLIIVDTLQKIRESAKEKCSYANDYESMAQLKTFADTQNICLMLVHHTRKQQADDRFERISGTNGLLGAADGVFLLQKEDRTDTTATLDISGRDLPDQRLHLTRDMTHLGWLLERRENQPPTPPPDPLLRKIACFVNAEHPNWQGTATALAQELALDLQPNKLTMHLNVNSERLLSECSIAYQSKRTCTERTIILTFQPSSPDGTDDATAV